MKLRVLILLLAHPLMAISQASDSSFEGNRPTNKLWKSTSTDKLKQDLLLHYDKFARPVQEGNKTSVVVELIVRHLELDEKRSVMTIHCWVNMHWNDGKLKWNASNYDGLKELHLADHEVWQPDIVPYNSAAGSTVDHYGNTNLIAYPNGTVLWVPPTIFQVFCQLDFTSWPFDTQTCSLKMGSWTYNGEQIDLFNSKHMQVIRDMPNLIPNSEWKLIEMKVKRNTVYYPCCSNPYVDLTFDLTIERESATYKALVVTPASAIILITLASFWLPPGSGDKITLTGASILINCLFLLYFTQNMPAMAGKTPYIVSFYGKTLYLVSFAVVIAVAVINIANNPKISPLPWFLKRLLSGWLGKCLLIESSDEKELSKDEEMIDSQPVLSDQRRHGAETNAKIQQKDWIRLAAAIDRIFFLVYSFAFVLAAVIYSV